MLIDTHAHLSDARFEADRTAAIERARTSGVGTIIEIGCDPDTWDEVLSLTAPGSVYCVLGIHPQDAKRADAQLWKKLRELCARPEVVGIGETGLDYHYEYSPRQVQKEAFERHRALAAELSKPLVIHCREAYDDLLPLLDTTGLSGIPGVIHCFSGSPEQALELADRGFLIGIDGPVTYPSAKTLREAVERLPMEKIVLETDSPYLPPQAFRGRRNEPAYLPLIAEEIAKVKGISAKQVAEITTRNARRLFGIKG